VIKVPAPVIAPSAARGGDVLLKKDVGMLGGGWHEKRLHAMVASGLVPHITSALRRLVRRRAPSDLVLDRRDHGVFRMYGEAMLRAQLLEFTIFQLAHLERRTPSDLDQALRKIDGLLKQPKGDQAKTMGEVGDELSTDVRDALGVRNLLAHEFLVWYRVEKVVRDDAPALAKAALTAMSLFFGDVQRRLDEAADSRLEARGITRPFLSDEEMDDLMATLGRWARRDDEDTA
jgi:hypothetical protein